MIQLILMLMSLVPASHAQSSEGMRLFNQGNALYEQGNALEEIGTPDVSKYRQANAKFTAAATAFAISGETKNRDQMTRYAGLMICEMRIHSMDIEELKDLVGGDSKKSDPYYRGSCLSTPEYPQVSSYVFQQIYFLMGKTTTKPEKLPAFKIEDPDLYTHRADCRSDKNNRDAINCFDAGTSRGDTYSFQLASDCTGATYLATIFVTDASGTCTRQVKSLSGNTSVSVSSPGGVASVRDAIILRLGDDVRDCYIKRQQGHACVAP